MSQLERNARQKKQKKQPKQKPCPKQRCFKCGSPQRRPQKPLSVWERYSALPTLFHAERTSELIKPFSDEHSAIRCCKMDKNVCAQVWLIGGWYHNAASPFLWLVGLRRLHRSNLTHDLSPRKYRTVRYIWTEREHFVHSWLDLQLIDFVWMGLNCWIAPGRTKQSVPDSLPLCAIGFACNLCFQPSCRSWENFRAIVRRTVYRQFNFRRYIFRHHKILIEYHYRHWLAPSAKW